MQRTSAPARRKRNPQINHGDCAGGFGIFLNGTELTGREDYTFTDVGIDSLSLVELMADIELLFAEHGATDLIKEVDMRVIQRLTVAEFFCLLDQIGKSDEQITVLRNALNRVREKHDSYERDRMRSDVQLEPFNCIERPSSDEAAEEHTRDWPDRLLRAIFAAQPSTQDSVQRPTHERAPKILLTEWPEFGTRSTVPGSGRRRSRKELEKRVHVVCGDISQHRLGLRSAQWNSLITRVQAVIHNAAFVNYVLNYDALRPHNINSSRELLRFSCTGIQKEFHFISSTIIFGWTIKRMLLEIDNNDGMEKS